MTHSMKRIVTLVPYKVTHKDGPNYGKDAHGVMNDDTVKLITDRYVVLRNVIPKEIITFALDTWKTIEANLEVNEVIFDEEIEPIPNSPKSSRNTSAGGHTTPMGVAMHRWLHRELVKRIDMDLDLTYSFTRKYERGAYLKAHSDRPSCEISATICLGYESDDGKPWRIWLDNTRNWVDISNDPSNQEDIFAKTQGIPIRKRKNAIAVDLEVGDILLYQGPNVIHWRDTFIGNYSYHMFLHYFTHNASALHEFGDFYTDTKRKGYAQEHGIALRFDGRENAYEQKNTESQEFREWSDHWDACPIKGQFINNYSKYEFEKIKE